MITFVPAYDPATEANLAVAAGIVPDGCRVLLGDRATRLDLLRELAVDSEPLFAMSHGRPDKLLAQGGDTALSQADLALLLQRPVFAFACHTATLLGREASTAGSVWWGYTGRITAPEASEEVLPLFVRIFTFLSSAFVSAGLPESCQAVLLRIAELCREAENEVDVLLAADPDLDAGPVLLCLLQIWQRLRVWQPGAPEPLQHPDAPPPALFEQPF